MTRLYLGKLNNVNQAELYKIVQTYGTVVDFLVKEKYAFVQYGREDEARHALSELDGKMINGTRILCEMAKPKDNTGYFLSHPRVYVGRLNNMFTKDEIYGLFLKYGEIVDFLYKDDYAFVEYKHISSAKESIQEMHSAFLKGIRIVVEEARPKESEESNVSKRLFIGKIGANLKKNDLIKAFSPYGDIIDILLKEDFAFVEYASGFSSLKAIEAMNGRILCGTKIIVEEARPKEKENNNEKTSSKRVSNSNPTPTTHTHYNGNAYAAATTVPQNRAYTQPITYIPNFPSNIDEDLYKLSNLASLANLQQVIQPASMQANSQKLDVPSQNIQQPPVIVPVPLQKVVMRRKSPRRSISRSRSRSK